MKILLVEDEKKIAKFLKKSFESEGFLVEVAYDGAEGLFMATRSDYSLILLDMGLPKKSGLTVLQELREMHIDTPVLCITANDTVDDVVTGLNAGSDGYLKKPFSFVELVARTRALIRLASQNRGTWLSFGDLRLDRVSHKLWRGKQQIDITEKEYRLLEYFMTHPNQVLTRPMIAENVWDYNFDPYSNIIDVYINYLRNKIDKGFKKKLIHTVRGSGYVLKEGSI